MFSYIIQDCKEINEKVKTMDKGSLKKRFTIAVVIGVIAALAEVFFFLSSGEITVAQLLLIVPLSIIGGVLGVFPYLIEWKFLIHPFTAAFHSKRIVIIFFPMLIFFAGVIYMPFMIYIAMKGIFVMNSRR